jgi:hypothetical protein
MPLSVIILGRKTESIDCHMPARFARKYKLGIYDNKGKGVFEVFEAAREDHTFPRQGGCLK